MWLLLILATLSPPRCAVNAQPRTTFAPLRYLRTRVTIEPDEEARDARLSLADGSESWRSSEVQLGPRTSWIEWRSLDVPAGEYAVILETFNSVGHLLCRAVQPIIVGGGDDQ
jgi:hypothetical protein